RPWQHRGPGFGHGPRRAVGVVVHHHDQRLHAPAAGAAQEGQAVQEGGQQAGPAKRGHPDRHPSHGALAVSAPPTGTVRRARRMSTAMSSSSPNTMATRLPAVPSQATNATDSATAMPATPSPQSARSRNAREAWISEDALLRTISRSRTTAQNPR